MLLHRNANGVNEVLSEPGIEQVAEPTGGTVPGTLVSEVHAQFVGQGGGYIWVGLAHPERIEDEILNERFERRTARSLDHLTENVPASCRVVR